MYTSFEYYTPTSLKELGVEPTMEQIRFTQMHGNGS